jgi:hypothetical protein
LIDLTHNKSNHQSFYKRKLASRSLHLPEKKIEALKLSFFVSLSQFFVSKAEKETPKNPQYFSQPAAQTHERKTLKNSLFLSLRQLTLF